MWIHREKERYAKQEKRASIRRERILADETRKIGKNEVEEK